jgi:MFS family permease
MLPHRAEKLPRNVKLLAAASLVNDIASEMIFPLLPVFLTTVLQAGKAGLGLVEGAADTVAGLLKLFAGGWSDRWGGRKPFVIVGYGLSSLARPLIALAAASWHVLAARVVDRTGKGIRTAPRDALIADSTPPALRGRAFAFHRAMDHLGAVIGPLLATVFVYFRPDPDDLPLLFALTAIPSVAVVLVVVGLRDQPPAATPAARPTFVPTLRPFDANFRLYILALALFALGNSSDAFLLLRAQELGVGTLWLPTLWGLFHVVKSLGNLMVGPLVDRHGARPLILVGWTVYGWVYLAFAVAAEAWHAWAFFMCYAAFYALTESGEKALVAALVPAENRGLAYGWFNFAVGAATLPSNLAFGFIYEVLGALAAFGTSASLAVLAALLLLFVRVSPRR